LDKVEDCVQVGGVCTQFVVLLYIFLGVFLHDLVLDFARSSQDMRHLGPKVLFVLGTASANFIDTHLFGTIWSEPVEYSSGREL